MKINDLHVLTFASLIEIWIIYYLLCVRLRNIAIYQSIMIRNICSMICLVSILLVVFDEIFCQKLFDKFNLKKPLAIFLVYQYIICRPITILKKFTTAIVTDLCIQNPRCSQSSKLYSSKRSVSLLNIALSIFFEIAGKTDIGR